MLSHTIFQIEIVYLDKEVRTFLKEELKNEGIHSFKWKKSYQQLEKIKKNISDLPEQLDLLVYNQKDDCLMKIEYKDYELNYSVIWSK